jgi:NADH dehydrogenase (ubiquinone) 1 alpha subcomplex subunit 13
MPQDMPPTGGYEPVQYKRNLPARGFRPATYLLMVGAVCTYGFWRVGQGIREQKYGTSTLLQHLRFSGSHNWNPN